MTAVAVAGLGAMGSRIAARLVAAGHERTAWNRSAGKVEPLAGLGAFPAATSAETGRPGRLLTRRAEMIATIKEARPGLAHIRLARAADGTGTGRWGAAEQEAALATMPAPEARAAVSLTRGHRKPTPRSSTTGNRPRPGWRRRSALPTPTPSAPAAGPKHKKG